jgi:cytochrome c oxidase subunit 2
MSIHPPTERLWWNEPVARAEKIWITVAFLWGLVMFFMMVYWHVVGKQNLSNEAYRIDPAVYQQRAMEAATQHTVRDEAGIPVVKPPPGNDIYDRPSLAVVADLRAAEEAGLSPAHQRRLAARLLPQRYQSADSSATTWCTVTPDQAGEWGSSAAVPGIGHHMMVGKMYVVSEVASWQPARHSNLLEDGLKSISTRSA